MNTDLIDNNIERASRLALTLKWRQRQVGDSATKSVNQLKPGGRHDTGPGV